MENQTVAVDKYRLGPFIIHGRENRIDTPEGSVVVLPKVMTLLLYVCGNGQRVLSFDELNRAVWPKEVVGDNAIYNLVGQLRKVLGDKASRPVYIQTVSKKGYRLMVEAEPFHSEQVTSEKTTNAGEPVLSQKPSVSLRPFTWLGGLLACFAIFAVFFWLLPNDEGPSVEAERQLQLARYQFYRGDGKGLERAIESLQHAIAIAPDWPIPKLELAYAFLRSVRLEPGNRDFWIDKARKISTDPTLGERGARLSAVVLAMAHPADQQDISEYFEQQDILPSARLAYARVLFDRGLSEASLKQELEALNACADCPYAYRRLATSQMVSGHVQQGFASFSRYRQLTDRNSQSPADNAGMVPLNLQNLRAMATWFLQTGTKPPLLSHQRNSLALFFLALGDIERAESQLSEEKISQPNHYDLYTQAAIAGAKGNFERSLVLLEQRQRTFPENIRFKRSVVYALWLTGRGKEAMESFKRFEILAEDATMPAIPSFEVWSLYAALLLETGNSERGMSILRTLETHLKAGTVTGSHKADIRLAAVLALQGKHEEALQQLDTALTQGWVSDFNQSWWYLQDSPYFRQLKTDPVFVQLVEAYHQRVAATLRQADS